MGGEHGLLGARLALYQVHSLTPDSPLFDDLALQDALAALPVRVGFSTSGPAQAAVVRRALALSRHGRPVFTAVQSTWNVLEPSVGPALAEAHDAGAHVLVKEALANGRLAVDPPAAVAELAAVAGRGAGRGRVGRGAGSAVGRRRPVRRCGHAAAGEQPGCAHGGVRRPA